MTATSARNQDPRHGPGVGALLAALDAVEELVGGGEVPVEIDHAGVETSLQRPTGLGEHGEHPAVVAEDLGGEPLDAVRPGDGREVFEEERGDPFAVARVVDHERCLGLVAPRPALVARPSDQLVVRLDRQRHAVGHVDRGEVIELLLTQLRLGGEVPTVDALGRLTAVELGEGRFVLGGQGPDERGVAASEHDRRRPG